MDKEQMAVERSKTASKMSLAIYGLPLVVTTSGRKNSSVDVSAILWREKMKAVLRKMRVRSQDLTDHAVREALSAVSASNCEGWFQCAGY